MQHRLKDKNSVVSADSGYRLIKKETGDRFLVLENGIRYEGPTKHDQTAIVKFELHGVRIEEKPLGKIEFRQKAIPTQQLMKSKRGLDQAEFQWRVSAVLLCVVLAVLAVPLSRTSPRQGRYSKLALALLIYIIYTNMLNVSRAWLNKEIISFWIGMWWVHALVVIFTLLLFIRWKPIFRKLWFGKN